MNKTPRLSKSGIEYLDCSWGIFSGCHNIQLGICPIEACWAKSMTKRFPNHYPKGFEPTFYPDALDSPLHLRKPSLIGVGWVGDVVGYGLDCKGKIYATIEQCHWHTFLFLTKNPQNLAKWSPFPDNCWVGVTATNYAMAANARKYLGEIKAPIKFLSLEPLLSPITDKNGLPFRFERGMSDIDWVIIGAQTKPTVYPRIEWVREIVEAADKAGVPVFLKDNLRSLIDANCPDESKLVPNHNPLFRMKHPTLCEGCEGKHCHACGVVWGMRQEMPA